VTFAALSDALDWVEAHWDDRSPPAVLHRSETDGELGGLAFTPDFARHLDALPSHTVEETRSTACLHWGRQLGRICRVCAVFDDKGEPIAESGVYQKRVLRYRWPMWRAVTKLQNALAPRRQPHPYALVLSLAAYGWDARQAARATGLPWDYAEAAYLRAIRQLHGRFEEAPIDTRTTTRSAPVTVAWTEMSESMQNAIIAGETSAA
jgi:hypothetical protein